MKSVINNATRTLVVMLCIKHVTHYSTSDRFIVQTADVQIHKQGLCVNLHKLIKRTIQYNFKD